MLGTFFVYSHRWGRLGGHLDQAGAVLMVSPQERGVVQEYNEHTVVLPPDIGTKAALFLDIDGTLVELAASPEKVVLHDPVIEVLKRLQRHLDGAVALVTGRAITDVDRLSRGLQLPVAGQHGAEIRDEQGNHRRLLDAGGRWPEAIERLRRFAGDHPEVLLEDKGLSVAVHYRAAPTMAEAVLASLERIAAELGGGYRVRRGKMVYELVPDHSDKGKAIVALLGLAPFRGRQPVFIGDDVTDEDGFRAVNERGGISVKVGEGQSAARYRLSDAAAVAAWLSRQARRLAALDRAGGVEGA